MARLLSSDGCGTGRSRASRVMAIATTASENVMTRSADRASISGESVVAMGEDCAVAIPFAPAPGPTGRRRNLRRGSPGPYRGAEDLVQETYLRAWRAYGGFEGRSSVRTWLYQIATNRCLTELDQRSRRVLPSGLGAPEPDPGACPAGAGPRVNWLQPVPDALVTPES